MIWVSWSRLGFPLFDNQFTCTYNFAGKKKVTFVTDFLKTEYLRKHGLAAILEGYCYSDPQNREVSKRLARKLMTSTKNELAFEEAFESYLCPKGNYCFAICNK